MPTIVVEVMPKAVLLDPQGKAVAGALHRLGKSRFTDVRLGKRFELAHLGETMLSNSVIEDVVSVHFVGSGSQTEGAHVAGTPVEES